MVSVKPIAHGSFLVSLHFMFSDFIFTAVMLKVIKLNLSTSEKQDTQP